MWISTALDTQNGIGAILGGGMDLPIKKWVAFRLFEADYVWGHHNYAQFASTGTASSLARPSFEGVRLRTGFVFSWGGAPSRGSCRQLLGAADRSYGG